MNSVWTSITSRAPCAIRQTRSKPLLELFNGYSRRYTSRWMHKGSREPRIGNITAAKTKSNARCFNTTAILSARRPPPPPRSFKSRDETERQYKDTYIEAPQRVASHTEGLDPVEQEETLTWRDYDPAGGMPLPDGELSQPEVNAIFGTERLHADTANYILSVLHWRRLSGALIDQQVTFPNDSGVSREHAVAGLQFLRTQYPDVDEEANGQLWIEEENQRLQQELTDRAVKLRLYKAEEGEETQDEATEPLPSESEQGTPEGRARTSESVLETTRKANEAAYERELAEKALADAQAETVALHSRRGPLELSAGVQPDTAMILYGPGGISISAPPTKAWLQPVERKPWVRYYEEHAQIIKDESIPQLSFLRRTVPSFITLLAILWLAAFLSSNYTPPPKEARIFPDTPPSVATLLALTATLGIFFLANRIPPLWRTYSKFFTLVPAYPYAASILGATFRHDTVAHLATNTATLWLMGLLLHEYVGRGTFLAVFLASGATGGFTSLVYNVLMRRWGVYVFGCSGAVLGVAAAVCTFRPNGRVVVGGVEVPVAAWVWLALWGGLEVVAAWRFPRIGVDHAGHVGGLIGGFACAMWLRAKAREESEDSKEENKSRDVQMVRIEGG